MKTAILTSKKAQEDLNNIKSKYDMILADMRNHQQIVDQFKQSQGIQAQQKDDKAREIEERNQQHAQKQQELDIKRMALTS